jgi:hypothetical protein
MKRGFLFFVMFLLIFSFLSLADSHGNLFEDDFLDVIDEDIYNDIGEVSITGDAGLTPDSTFYFLENLVESVLVGENPEKALGYKEEKILELQEMVNSGNQEGAQEVLAKVEKYNNIIKKEVSPDIEKKVRASSKATKAILSNLDLEGTEWESVKGTVDANLKNEDKIALAAKISGKIAGLCTALSNIDPLEYSKVCKTDDDAPKWKRDLDKKLTKEQRKEAEEFFGIMSQCFKNPVKCRCDDISIEQFADKCKIIAPLAVKCEKGDEQACEEMDDVEDPIDLLPDYLQDVLEDVESRYDNSKHDLHIPLECVEVGASSREDCMKVMFKIHAPPECSAAFERGEINPKNEHEGRQACEKIMFKLEAPNECLDAGLKDFDECEKFMFKLDSPQECLDAGLSGGGRDDRRKCDVIRFKLDAPQECLDAGIDGTNRDDWKKCEAIRFKLDSPKECLDAGLTGEGRDDWKKCNKITFLLDAPEECQKFADDRDPWKSCQPVQFKLDAPQVCLDAGLDGSGRRDWDECQKIQFKSDAPQECLNAGLDGSGKRDWDECNKLTENNDFDSNQRHGSTKNNCNDGEYQVCEGNECKCVKNENDENKIDCSEIYCKEGFDCEQNIGCVPRDNSGSNQCNDCKSQCPGASSIYCNEDNQCQCIYEKESVSPECNSNEKLICEGIECKCVEKDHETDSSHNPDSNDSNEDATEDESNSNEDATEDNSDSTEKIDSSEETTEEPKEEKIDEVDESDSSENSIEQPTEHNSEELTTVQ